MKVVVLLLFGICVLSAVGTPDIDDFDIDDVDNIRAAIIQMLRRRAHQGGQ